MKPSIEELGHLPVSRQGSEAVERKGIGHPDSICDAAMEHASLALSRAYRETFGRILHHNLDKGLLVAGRTSPKPGGGTVLEPMRFVLGDRATSSFHDRAIDAHGIVENAVRDWIRTNLPRVDPDRHVVFQNELKPGSPELNDIFSRPEIGANDTSAAVGYAPLTETERLVFSAERFLNAPEFKARFPVAGEDIKVMGYRQGRALDLTVALAFVDAHVPDSRTYFARKEEMKAALHHHLKEQLSALDSLTVDINTLDDPARGENGMYLTVLGTSAEAGDCGAVGRGNKVNGLISLNRPMSMEAAAGKNAVSHVGKIYSFMTHSLAEAIYAQVEGLEEVYVWLGSKIGLPVGQPALVSVKVVLSSGVTLSDVRGPIRDILGQGISDTPAFLERLLKGEFPVC